MKILNLIFFVFFFGCEAQKIEVWLSQHAANKYLQKSSDLQFVIDSGNNYYTITVKDDVKYQQMDGFGASLTDSSAWLLKYRLSESKREQILKELFSSDGINLSILRQPIGASDFNWESWSYADTTNNQDDFSLNSFALWRDDDYIRPMLDKALKVNPGRIKIFSSPWSPPAFMKTGKHLFGAYGGTLRTDCYDVYADYFIKYINGYKAKGSPVYAITVQNEPQYAPYNYPGMLMSAQEQINFISKSLGPKLKAQGIDTKIIAFDHNYDESGLAYATAVLNNTEASKYISGSGFHTYAAINHQAMSTLHSLFPSKDVWITESGSGTWIGDYKNQFQNQMMHLMRSPRNWAKGVILWNIALDQNSAPKLAYVDTGNVNRGLLTIRSDTTDSVTYESDFFAIGHSSKFVTPGAYRIDSNTFEWDLESVAYLNPDNTIVVVLSNRNEVTRQVKVKWNLKSATFSLPPKAAATLKWSLYN